MSGCVVVSGISATKANWLCLLPSVQNGTPISATGNSSTTQAVIQEMPSGQRESTKMAWQDHSPGVPMPYLPTAEWLWYSQTNNLTLGRPLFLLSSVLDSWSKEAGQSKRNSRAGAVVNPLLRSHLLSGSSARSAPDPLAPVGIAAFSMRCGKTSTTGSEII